jgi:DNA-binding beta-propeller fold protein YncE
MPFLIHPLTSYLQSELSLVWQNSRAGEYTTFAEFYAESPMSIQRSLCSLSRPFAAALLLSSLLAAPALLSAQKPYHIIDRWKIGGEGGWDYLLADSSARRLYITHAARVEVIDTTNGKHVGAITGLHGTHGIALDDAGKFGYISDGGGNAVVVFDRATLAIVDTIPTGGQNPDGIVFEPATQTVWAFDGRSKDAAVISAATRKVIATIPLPGKPEFPAVDGKGIVFDNIEDKNEIVRLDAHSLKLTAEWPIAGCDSPSGLVFDIPGHRLFPVCDGKKMGVVDSNTGKVLATPAIGDGPDAAGWDAKDKLVFSSNGEGTLSVINAGAPGYPLVEELPTQKGARTMAYDAATDRIYLVAAEYGPTPAPTAAVPHPRPRGIPDTFTVLVVAR